ncbi:DNA gyrase subunit A, partial [Lactobacillus murinus]
KGIKTVKVAEKNGYLAGLTTVSGDEDVMVITDTGVIIRTNVANISQTGRATMGVKVMRLDEEASIVTFALVDAANSKDVEEE